MIWIKTPRGLEEVAASCLNVAPASRNLLRLIDGSKSEEMLLRHGIGVVHEQFRDLWKAGLIAPLTEPEQTASKTEAPRPPTVVQDPRLLGKVLRQLISEELGFAGFGLAETLARARSLHELQNVADAVVLKIKERKGDAVADAARQRLLRLH